MKRSFTLIELLVVILIIGIILMAFVFLMVGYQKKAAFKNDILKFKDTFFVWDKTYSTPQRNTLVRGVFIVEDGKSFKIGYELSGKINVKTQFFKIARIEDIYFSGNKLSQAKLIKEPYKIECLLEEGGNLKDGKISFKLKGASKDYCGEINLAICKLTIIKCLN